MVFLRFQVLFNVIFFLTMFFEAENLLNSFMSFFFFFLINSENNFYFIKFVYLYFVCLFFCRYFILNGLERVVRLLILPKRNYVSEPFCLLHIFCDSQAGEGVQLELWLESGEDLKF